MLLLNKTRIPSKFHKLNKLNYQIHTETVVISRNGEAPTTRNGELAGRALDSPRFSQIQEDKRLEHIKVLSSPQPRAETRKDEALTNVRRCNISFRTPATKCLLLHKLWILSRILRLNKIQSHLEMVVIFSKGEALTTRNWQFPDQIPLQKTWIPLDSLICKKIRSSSSTSSISKPNTPSPQAKLKHAKTKY